MGRVMDEDISYALYFAQGRHSARIGQTLTASPYIGHDDPAWQAWTDGYKSVDFSSLGASDRALVFFEGWSAAQVKLDPRHCPYLVDDGCEKVDLWVLGYTSATAL